MAERAVSAAPEGLVNALADAGIRLRFGATVGAEQKNKTKKDISQQLPDLDIPEATRASSGFLGANRLGNFLTAFGNEAGLDFGLRGGEEAANPERAQELRNALIQGIALQNETENLQGKAGSGTSAPLPPGILEVLESIRPSQRTGQISRPTASSSIRGQQGGKANLAAIFANADKQGRQVAQVGGTPIINRGTPLVRGVSGGQQNENFFSSDQFRNAPGGFDPEGQFNLPNLAQEQQGRINNVQADTGTLDNIVGDLRGFQAGGSDIIQGLQNFNPFSGTAQGTLNELLSTGAPTDVSGIADAAKIRGQQEFDDSQDRIGERLASLGLTSSSARSAATDRERGRLGERIGAAGLEAGVGAQESATNRRLQALNPALAGSGQRLNAQSTALQGRLGQSGQNLSALQGAAGSAGQSAGLNLQGRSSQANAGNQFLSTVGNRGFGGGGGGGTGGPAQRQGNSAIGGLVGVDRSPGNASSRFNRGGVRGARGGQTPKRDQRFTSFLRNTGADLIRGQRGSLGADPEVFEQQAIAALGGEDAARALFEDPKLRESLTNDAAKSLEGGRFGVGIKKPSNLAQFLALGVGQQGSPASVQGGVRGKDLAALGLDSDTFAGTALDLERSLRNQAGSVLNENVGPVGPGADTAATNTGIGSIRSRSRTGALDSGRDAGLDVLGRQGSRANRGFFQDGGMTRQVAQGGGVPQPDLPQELGQLVPGILDPRRQFFNEGGGTAPGLDDGTDKIPALLRSEELVVTPEITEMVEGANPNMPNPELIKALQQLAQQPLEFDDREGEFVAQHGGVQPGIVPGQFSIPIPGAQGQTGVGPGDFDLLEFINSLGTTQVDPTTGQAVVTGGAGPAPEAPGIPPELLAQFGQTPELPTELSDPGFNIPGRVPNAPSQGTFLEDVGEAGERRFSLTGGDPGTPSPLVGTGRGTVSSPVIRDDQGVALRDRLRTPDRLERAQNRSDLIRSAINADPVGGPEKQARLFNALQGADRELDSAINEIIASQELGIRRQQADAQTVSAQANLNQSVARTLQAQAQKATAESALSKQLLEAASADPFLANVLNAFEVQSKLADKSPEAAAQLDAVIRRLFESRGVQLTESGTLARLFGAPEFEVQSIQPELGEPAPPGTEDISGLLGRVRGQVSNEQLAALVAAGAI